MKAMYSCTVLHLLLIALVSVLIQLLVDSAAVAASIFSTGLLRNEQESPSNMIPSHPNVLEQMEQHCISDLGALVELKML